MPIMMRVLFLEIRTVRRHRKANNPKNDDYCLNENSSPEIRTVRRQLFWGQQPLEERTDMRLKRGDGHATWRRGRPRDFREGTAMWRWRVSCLRSWPRSCLSLKLYAVVSVFYRPTRASEIWMKRERVVALVPTQFTFTLAFLSMI